MPGRARTTSLLLLAATAPWLVGCGDGEATEASPTPIVIPGSTVTIGTEGAPVPSVAPTAPGESGESGESSEPPTSEPTQDPPAGPASVATAEELLQVVAEAVQGARSVHLSVGTATATVIESDHQYLSSDDYAAVLTLGAQPVEVRRVDDVLYSRPAPGEPFAPVDPTQATGLLAALPGWDVIGDLADVLTAPTGFRADGPGEVDGTAVRTFTFFVDAAEVAGGATVPDDVTGPAEVTFAVDRTGLPVRVELRFVDSDRVVRTDYSAWGAPVEVAAP